MTVRIPGECPVGGGARSSGQRPPRCGSACGSDMDAAGWSAVLSPPRLTLPDMDELMGDADRAHRRAVEKVGQRFPNADDPARVRYDAMLVSLSRLHLDVNIRDLAALSVLAIEEADRWRGDHPDQE